MISGVKGFLDVQEKSIRGKASLFTVLQERVLEEQGWNGALVGEVRVLGIMQVNDQVYPRKGDGSENLVDSGKKCDGSIVGAAERVATLVAADDFPSAPLGRHYAGTKHGVVKGE